MNLKNILHIITTSVLVAAVFVVTPVIHADVTATSVITEQTLPSSYVLTTGFEPTETLPFFYSIEIDQNQPSGPAHMAAFSQADLAQSFMQTNGNIAGAGILLYAGIGSTDNVTIQLWDALPNAGGIMIAEASAMGTAGQWVDVFWTAAPITPMTTYYLVFSGNTTLGITGDLNNPYPNGHVFANSGYNPWPNYDYAFRTYWDTEVPIERHTWANVKALFD